MGTICEVKDFSMAHLIEQAARVKYELPIDPKLEDFQQIFRGLHLQIEYVITRALPLLKKNVLDYEEWVELYWTTERLCEVWKSNHTVALYWRKVVDISIGSIAARLEMFGKTEEVWLEELFAKLRQSSCSFSEWLPGIFRDIISRVVVPVNARREITIGKKPEQYWMVQELAAAVYSVPIPPPQYVNEIHEKIRKQIQWEDRKNGEKTAAR